jgi:hypothetical protein
MKEQIQTELSKLEDQYGIRILYAVESGSRAWGFASVNSDWDVRFIYVPRHDWYLSIEENRDSIEQMLPGDLDLSGWELRKALRLFRKSNPPLNEWLDSSIIYKEEGSLAAAMRQLNARYFNPRAVIYHYLHMARNNWQAYFKDSEVRIKKYFYVLRPLMACRWVERTGQMAPVLFDTMLHSGHVPPAVVQATEALLVRKMAGEELSTGGRIQELDAFIEQEIAYFLQHAGDADVAPRTTNQDLNNLFGKVLYEAWGAWPPHADEMM